MKIKVAVWGDEIASATCEFWKSLAIETEIIEISEEIKNQPEVLFRKSSLVKPTVETQFDIAFLEPSIGEAITRAANEVLAEVKDIGWADLLVRQQTHLWPQLIMREALRLSIVQAAPDLDSHSVGYVTGKGPLARMAAVVLIALGFERLAVVSDDPKQVQEELRFLQKKYFDVQVKCLSDSEMTMQPNNGSIIINTLSHANENAILDDLPYLNYIKKEGLVVDLPFDKGPNQLLDEAKHVGMRVLTGVSARGLRDYLLLQQLAQINGADFRLPSSEYLQKWSEISSKA